MDPQEGGAHPQTKSVQPREGGVHPQTKSVQPLAPKLPCTVHSPIFRLDPRLSYYNEY